MSTSIRTLQTQEEVEQAFGVFLRAMVGLPVSTIDRAGLFEPGRYIGAFDGPALVGGADSYTSWLTVPGGQRVPHAAVTHVGVLPTHTRRGILTSLMARQLDDAVERGEVVASLRASEATIYERFGYAVASSATSARIDRARAVLRPGAVGTGTIRLADGAVATDLLADLYEPAAWTGAIRRPDPWWRLRRQLAAAHEGPNYVVVHATDGVDDGYAVYQPRDTGQWFTSPARTVAVSDFVAHGPDAHLGLLRHLLSLDLVDVVELATIPLDDPLPTLVVDHRSVVLGPAHDETWLRLLDVEAALQARTYRSADPVVIEVTDRWLPRNEGRYEVGAKGSERTDADADLTVDVAGLAAVYLGGTRWWQLAHADRVHAATPHAIARADDLFATARLPFAGTSF